MKDRIKTIMESQHMTQQTFSQLLGISSAALSSIYNSRTKPTLAIVDAIHKKFPRISTDWLMYGTEPMYKDQDAQMTSGQQVNANPPQMEITFPDNPKKENISTSDQGKKPNTENNPGKTNMKMFDNGRHITEIKVYYDDLTYESFIPARTI